MTAFPQTALAASGWPTLAMPSGFNSLAANAVQTSTGEIDNRGTTARFDWIDLHIGLGSFNPSAGGMVEVTMLPKFNGSYPSLTVWPVGSRAFPQAACQLDTGAAAKVALFSFYGLRPTLYKVMVRNGTGVAFAASGNSVAWAGTLRETRAT